jgi:hypothetical protein
VYREHVCAVLSVPLTFAFKSFATAPAFACTCAAPLLALSVAVGAVDGVDTVAVGMAESCCYSFVLCKARIDAPVFFVVRRRKELNHVERQLIDGVLVALEEKASSSTEKQ